MVKELYRLSIVIVNGNDICLIGKYDLDKLKREYQSKLDSAKQDIQDYCDENNLLLNSINLIYKMDISKEDTGESSIIELDKRPSTKDSIYFEVVNGKLTQLFLLDEIWFNGNMIDCDSCIDPTYEADIEFNSDVDIWIKLIEKYLNGK